MPILKPFFSYYGAKFRMARKLGMPQRDTVVEPFAGSACYSCYWAGHIPKVILIDTDPVIVGLWRYLIRVKEQEIMNLPIDIRSISELRKTCKEAKWLIGFWFNKGLSRPAINRSHWSTADNTLSTSWSEPIRHRIASQLKYIRHWQILEGSYTDAPKIEAHWHIDPPYQRAGRSYKYNAIDYTALGKWCLDRKGFVQVCEQTNADWLPFVEFTNTKGVYKGRNGSHSREVLFQQGRASLDLFYPETRGEDYDNKRRRARTAQNNQDEASWEETSGRRRQSMRGPTVGPGRSSSSREQLARRELASPESRSSGVVQRRQRSP